MKLSDQRRFRMTVAAVGLSVFVTIPLWSQTENAPPQQPVAPLVGIDNGTPPVEGTDHDADNNRMLVPPPVSGETYSVLPLSQERSNYLRYGVSFTGAYTDNAVGGASGHPISDISYSVAPIVELDETTSRLEWLASYAPGFTFYQRTRELNAADHNASIDFRYRLSPHVSFSAQDTFQKSSSMFNQPNYGSIGSVSGGAQQPNFSVVAPIADRLSNSGNVSLIYQFALNSMIGINGMFSNLNYPNPDQVPGLYDSRSQAGSAFYSRRVSKSHYLGTIYQYQRLLTSLTEGLNETQTHAVLFFYTLYPTTRFSLSFFGGPQYSDTVQPAMPPLEPQPFESKTWTPAMGASLSWQGRLNTFALSYFHIISGGGGLIGAVRMDNATASFRQQISRYFSASLGGAYVQNNVIGSTSFGLYSGHTVSGTASLQREFGQHLVMQLGYTRIHQTYNNVAVIALAPDTNREFVSFTYQFSRPLGR